MSMEISSRLLEHAKVWNSGFGNIEGGTGPKGGINKTGHFFVLNLRSF